MTDFEKARGSLQEFIDRARHDNLLKMYVPDWQASADGMAAAHAAVVAERDALRDACAECQYGRLHYPRCPALVALRELREAPDDHATSTEE